MSPHLDWPKTPGGWWLCDNCGQPINPRWKKGTPTPEVPVYQSNGALWWVHRRCAS